MSENEHVRAALFHRAAVEDLCAGEIAIQFGAAGSTAREDRTIGLEQVSAEQYQRHDDPKDRACHHNKKSASPVAPLVVGRPSRLLGLSELNTHHTPPPTEQGGKHRLAARLQRSLLDLGLMASNVHAIKNHARFPAFQS